MKTGAQLIKELENLSKIELSEEEKQTAQKDLQTVLDFMDKLSELDTDGVGQDSAFVSGIEALREDTAVSAENPQAVLKNAKDIKNGCFAVPKTVE